MAPPRKDVILVHQNGRRALKERFELTRLVSSITHGHIRSVIACFYFLEYTRLLIDKQNKFEVYGILRKEFPENIMALGIDVDELAHFDRLLADNIWHLEERDVESGGYIVDDNTKTSKYEHTYLKIPTHLRIDS